MKQSQWAKPTSLQGYLAGYKMTRHHAKLIQWSLNLMDIQTTDRILDVGCGSGDAIKRMAGIATGGFVAGVDHSRAMVHMATMCNLRHRIARKVDIKLGSVENLPWPEQSFDKVCAIESFPFWAAPRTGLAEISRVLRPGGRVFIVVAWNKDVLNPDAQEKAEELGMTLYSSDTVQRFLLEAGFKETGIISKGNWLVVQGVK